MRKMDAKIIKVLADLNLNSGEEKPLTPEQEDMLARALDPEKEFLHSVEKIFTPNK